MSTWEFQSESRCVSACLQQSVETVDSEPWLPVTQRLSKFYRKIRPKALKILQRNMVKRRSHGSIWQNVFVSLRFYVSLKPRKLWLQEEYRELYLHNKMLCSFVLLQQFIQNICIKRIWHWITNKGLYAIKPNQTKPNQIIYTWYICITRIWHWITYKGLYAIKPNQNKPYIFNIYINRIWH